MRTRSRAVKMPSGHVNRTILVTTMTAIVYLGTVVLASPIEEGGGSNPAGDTPIVAIGRCRVQCLKKFPGNIGKTRENRQKQHERHECWKLCENLMRNPKVYAPLCPGQLCSEGCQTACSYRNNLKTVSNTTTQRVHWRFAQDVETETDFLWIDMKWEEPVADLPVSKPHPIVYTLLMREKNDAWQLIHQTSDTEYKMKYDEAMFVPEFLIQAVDDTGMIAERVFYVNQMIFREIIEPVLEYGALEDGGTAVSIVTYNVVNLTYHLQYDDKEDEGLMVFLSWEHPPCVGQEGEQVFYQVVYILNTCGVYEDLPKCSYPTDLYSAEAPAKRNEKPEYTIKQLLYNTGYKVSVSVYDDQDREELADIVLKTPRCLIPTEDFRRCLDSVVTETPDVTTQIPLDELVRDVTVRLLPNNGEPGQVLVNISWNFISDPTVVNFSVKIKCDEDNGFLFAGETVSGTTHFITTLLENTIYEVVVDVFDPSRGGDDIYLDESQQRMLFNTSDLQLAEQEVPQAVRMQRQNMRAVNSVIIGVTCVGVLVVVGLIVLFLYKKRQSFKGIIIPKTTVAKSNSYKSSVGGKADYSNQLMVFSDEWELDPRQLKFSTPLGQGAFGKVVTGYYADRKVAIKLVKEGAPLSYKEDLVAEINLMKRLGTHPNIVCLIGACTISEPIALVMEYVPYGNLQNFLKKCRLEGDLQKRSNGPSEIQYSMLQDCGGIENGVITPTDMLSFARQVAMAMEYLAEEKYVHRDLAARNVLLHYNKVVKVCDFGLSRDIFNDNQYKKLTNGKLPLKWMAIESLRDRVFTTQSDVWSFGILLWEIVTMGASPYPNIALADLYYVLSNNYRMDKPSNCSNELYALMRACWAENPLDRPTFMELREQLEDLMAEDRNYLVLEEFDVPLSASESSSNPTASELFSSDMCPSQIAMDVVSGSSESNSSASASASASAAGLLRQGPPLRRPPMTIDVCIHQKSTERLMRPSESDSSP